MNQDEIDADKLYNARNIDEDEPYERWRDEQFEYENYLITQAENKMDEDKIQEHLNKLEKGD